MTRGNRMKILKQPHALGNNTICPLASLEDIEAMKAVAISQRGSVKDFIDLYFILKKTGHSFNNILELVMKKYEVEKGYSYQLKTSFVYFDDAEKEVDSITMIRDTGKSEKIQKKEWEQVKKFFKRFSK